MTEPLLDPFSQVYNALWKMVNRNKNLNDYLPKGNRIRFEHESDVDTAKSDAQMPELALLCGGGSFGGKDNSTTRSVTRNYLWALTTGDFRINPVFNKISWELFRSMVDWSCVLCNLTWCDCNFVQECRVVSADDSFLPQSLQENIPGWSSIWQVEVDFAFNYNSLTIKE